MNRAVVALLVLSAAARFVASLPVRAPWIAPDEMVYALTGRGFWQTGQLKLVGLEAPFYGFYPLLAGLPLTLFGANTGLVVLQAGQAVLVSLTGAVVFAWTRDIVSARWGFAAAAMAIASPELARSGLIMTEAVFLPAVTFALWRLYVALQQPTPRNQALVGAALTIAVAVRFQGLVLIPAVVGALMLMSVLQRRPRLALGYGPLFATAAAGVALLVGGRLLIAPGTGLLGAYEGSVGSGYQAGEVLRWTVREAGDVFLLVVGLPLIGVFCLAIAHLRSGTRDPKISALLAVTFSFGLLAIVQVGAFASLNVHQLAARDLITVAPPIFVAFTVWLGRGMPRPQPITSIAVCVVAACAVFLPVGTLVRDQAVPDALMTSPLVELANATSHATLVTVWVVVAVGLALLAILTPRAAAPVLPAIIFVALLGSSVAAQHEIYVRSQFDRSDFFGRSPTGWIDDHAGDDVTYLDAGDPLWNAVWQQAFWNERLTSVATLKADPPGPRLGIPRVVVGEDGRLRRADGKALTTHLFVAPKPLTLRGRRVAEIHQGRDEPGLVLWRVRGAPTVSYTTIGLHPNTGDVEEEIDITAYACGPGSLDLTLFAKQGVPGMKQGTPGLFLQAGNEHPTQIIVSPGHLWRLRVPTPPTADGKHRCVFRIGPDGAVGITSLEFRRGSRKPPGAGWLHAWAPGVTEVWEEQGRSLPTPREVVYCLNGRELRLLPRETTSDVLSREGSLAVFVAGEGLSCHPPPQGYVQEGFATVDMHVPGGLYQYFALPRTDDR